MKQAKVINEQEMKRLLAVIDASQHSERNRCAVMLSYLAGLRVGEIAALTIGDVFDADGNVRDQILLKAAYTKGNHARTVFVSKRLDKELVRFRKSLGELHGTDKPLLMTQKRGPFSPNTLCQLFGQLYAKAGLDGAVLVQPSFLGIDNSYLLDVLDKSRRDPNGLCLYGVCMTEPDISIDEIQEMKARRIIGVRLNCVKRELPDLRSRLWQSFCARIHEANWHLELHIEADRLLSFLDTLPPELNTVVDHFCLAGNDRELAELLERAHAFISCDSLFVKVSAPYRLPACGVDGGRGTLAPSLAKVLNDTLGAKQLIWGSDWPFTQHEKMQNYETSVLQGKHWIASESEPLPNFPIRLLG